MRKFSKVKSETQVSFVNEASGTWGGGAMVGKRPRKVNQRVN
jgi:hypothetical protein